LFIRIFIDSFIQIIHELTTCMLAELMIATISTIVGSGIVVWIEYGLDQRKYSSSPEARMKSLTTHHWRGYFKQKNPDGSNHIITVDFNMELKRKGRKIVGSADCIPKKTPAPMKLMITNGVFDGNILKIEYANEDLRVFQKGSIIMKLNAHATHLDGCFVGYSPGMERIISGEISLKAHVS
jgi:hypothetical protein